ncbi:MAG TPA: NADH-quinone oxidoreductase subunit J [Chthonomonadaceae bacterium]|nr:NADH-quinone oxidoreductase subunit J [Chthonomonadaceae bacterium]
MNALSGQIAFCSLSALTLVSALMVVRSRSIVHAGFWLLPCFIGVAGLFAALEAHFFFVVQLLIYAGAILVLILFAVMLTRDAAHPHHPQENRMGGAAALICSSLAVVSAALLTRQQWAVTTARPADASAQTRALGEALIGLYALPFEVASLLLLAALVGAIVLAKAERGPEPAPPPLADLGGEIRKPAGAE